MPARDTVREITAPVYLTSTTQAPVDLSEKNTDFYFFCKNSFPVFTQRHERGSENGRWGGKRGRENMVLTPEESDLKRAKSGDRLAFDRVFKRYKAQVACVCARLLRGKEDEEQAVIEVWTVAWKALPNFRGECPLEHWLHQIANNTCFNLLRTKKSHLNIQALPLDAPTLGGGVQIRDPQVDVEKEGMHRVLWAQILLEVERQAQANKPPWDLLDRAIFERFYCREMSLTEIATELNKPITTIDYRHKQRIKPVLEAVERKMNAE